MRSRDEKTTETDVFSALSYSRVVLVGVVDVLRFSLTAGAAAAVVIQRTGTAKRSLKAHRRRHRRLLQYYHGGDNDVGVSP